MFTFHVSVPHGRGWRRLMNEQATSYQQAARNVRRRTGANRVKVEPESAAEACSMGYKSRIVRFNRTPAETA